MESLERYVRQNMIPNWNQDKLNESQATIIGDSLVADFLLVDLLSMGFGGITRIGASDLFEFEKINPLVNLEVRDEKLSSLQQAEMLLSDSKIIIDASNDLNSKYYSSCYAKKNNLHYLSVAASKNSFSLCIEKLENELLNFHKKELNTFEGIISSIISSGILTDELRKMVMPMKNDIVLGDYNYSRICSCKALNKKIIQIGAGATGTFSLIPMAYYGAEITLVDFDIIEESNLNRQFMFYDSIGKNKAQVLKERCNKFKGKINVLEEKIGEDFKPLGYDYSLSCVDNDTARYYMNKASMEYNIPLINCGSSIKGGNAMPFIPGKTACLDCQTRFKLKEKYKETIEKRNSAQCFHPSIIISNQIIGGLLVNCLMKSIMGIYEKSTYASGSGIFDENINNKCFEECENVRK